MTDLFSIFVSIFNLRFTATSLTLTSCTDITKIADVILIYLSYVSELIRLSKY